GSPEDGLHLSHGRVDARAGPRAGAPLPRGQAPAAARRRSGVERLRDRPQPLVAALGPPRARALRARSARAARRMSVMLGRDSGAGVPWIVIDPTSTRPLVGFSELWHYRDLLYFLTWRYLSARHKQSVMGFPWSCLA